MREKIGYFLVAVIGIGIFLASFFYSRSLIHRQALERIDLCYRQSVEANVPLTVCSQIASTEISVPSVFDVSILPFCFLGLTFIVLLLLRILSLEKRVKELIEHHNA